MRAEGCVSTRRGAPTRHPARLGPGWAFLLVRTALDHLSQRLVKAGVNVGHTSPLLPDLANSARVYMRLLLPVVSARWPTDQYKPVGGLEDAFEPFYEGGAGFDYRLAAGGVVGGGDLWRASFLMSCRVSQSPLFLPLRGAHSPVSQRFPTHTGTPKTRRPGYGVTE